MATRGDFVTAMDRPVGQMLADLVEAGGELRVEDSEQGSCENLTSAAIRYNKVPDGMVIAIARGNSWAERIIRVEDPLHRSLDQTLIRVGTAAPRPESIPRAVLPVKSVHLIA